MVCSSGRSKCENSAGALHAIGGGEAGAGSAAGCNPSDGAVRPGKATAGIAAGVTAGAATGMTSGATKRAGLGSWLAPGLRGDLRLRRCVHCKNCLHCKKRRDSHGPRQAGDHYLFVWQSLTRRLHSHGVKMRGIDDL